MRTVDLFSGCGGMSLGFQSAGYNIVAAFENWPAAIECYKQNFKHPVIETDLSIVDEAIMINCWQMPKLFMQISLRKIAALHHLRH